jgi:FkbH-like protein
MDQRVDQRLKEWIGAAEMALLDVGEDTAAERFASLAASLLRRTPERLWTLLSQASREELDRIPNVDGLLGGLVERLLSAGRLDTAQVVAEASGRWEIRLADAVLRRLAQAQVRVGATTQAEAITRDLLKRTPGDGESLRLLFRLLRDSGRSAEAHQMLDRLVAHDRTGATASFARRQRTKLPPMTGRTVRIALLSSYVLDSLVPFLDVECRQAGVVPEFYVGPFNQVSQEIMNNGSGLYAFAPDIVFLALDLEDVFPTVREVPSAHDLARGRAEIRDRIMSLTRELRARSEALIVVHEMVLSVRAPYGILDNCRGDSVLRWVEDVNRDLADALAAQGHALLLPLRQVLARAGTDQGQSRKLQYMARMRHGDATLSALARESMRYIKPLKGLTRKCVVVDLDGTLWGGVVGEDGPDGIALGPTAPGVEYVDFQQALLNLTRRGILLAVCSKNNHDDVLPVLREHKHMVLREEHFSAMRINWRSKAENLAEIANELNIGLDALVFIDDNPIERELVRQMLPEVLTVELPRDAAQYRLTLEELSDFELLVLTREDELRVGQYAANRGRQALERSSGSLEEYLHSLEIRVDIAPAAPAHVPRLVQLFNKTNQFNTTTRRYQTPDVERFITSPGHRVWVLEASDRFGQHGLVGAAVVRQADTGWIVDSMLLSCRAMGLAVETALLARVAETARTHDIDRLVGEFIPTAKNGPSADVFQRHGFRLEGETDAGQVWVLDPRIQRIKIPTWISATATEG